ncbi:MAG: glycosyltransferase [Alphaproteobacteria bacterium]
MLVFCSRLTPKTRLLQAVEAVQRVSAEHPDVLLAVIGDGTMRADAEALVEEKGAGNSVRFLGAMFDEDQLAPWFLSAECLLYPGPIGLSLLHAFAYGLPVVTHDNLRNQRTRRSPLSIPVYQQLTFVENDIADFAKALGRIISDPAPAVGDERAATASRRTATTPWRPWCGTSNAALAMSGRSAELGSRGVILPKRRGR